MENQEFQKTINYIFELIENGMLQLGDKLPTERAISVKLGVSRNFVREAIRSLEALGLVECRQGSGNYLADNIKDSISKAMNLLLLIRRITREEVAEFRRFMDKAICHYIIKNGVTDESKNELAAAVARIKNAATHSELIEADKSFHYALVYATNSRIWITVVDAVSDLVEKWIDVAATSADKEATELVIAAHEKILDGIVDGNISAVLNAVDEHYDIVADISL